MNIEINLKKFQNGLRIIERVISRNASLPILGTVLMKTQNSSLLMSATNLEMGISYNIGARVDKQGEIAVPARVLSEFVNNINGEKIGISVNNKNTLQINSNNFKTNILGLPTNEFPIIPTINKSSSMVINNRDLKQALVSVIDSASLSETRPELSGIFINITPINAEFAATDSFRLAEKTVMVKSAVKKSLIVPRTTALELIKIMDLIDEDVNLATSSNQLFVYNDNLQFVTRLIDGHYPEYKKIIPEKFIGSVVVSKDDFEKSVRMSSVFSSNIYDMTIRVLKNNLEIKASSSEKGEIVANTQCLTRNEPFKFSVNYHYLLDGMKTIPTENVIIKFTGEGSPILIQGEKMNDYVYVIMPLRNNS
ncbi:MAG: DNA polymerase III (beta subunit) [Parcubacteria group bacterium Licking1014_17]|nr:MAG: DNA polymerase III (beta subunit) [Parcubacteria group bacterium Licking1014_17]